MNGKADDDLAIRPAAFGAPTVADLRGISRLTVDAVVGVTGLVEDMYRTIAELSPMVGAASSGPARGIAGFVHGAVRGVARLVGSGVDAALARFETVPGDGAPSSTFRDAALASLNGVLGDHLVATGNPLAIPMRLRQAGEALDLERSALAARFPDADGRLVVLVHGLCMNDRQWRRAGHDHGAALAADLGLTPLYLFYDTGRAIADNGRDFAARLERLVEAWPVPVTDLVVIGHSMGGLVARAACLHAEQAHQAWLGRLTRLVFLGTPHHGSPWEQAGGWVDAMMGVSPYTAPFTRLGGIRSAGIKDLRHGRIRDDERDGPIGPHHDRRKPTPLPAGVACYAVAACHVVGRAKHGAHALGDGLVPVKSALGRHRDPAMTLAFPADHQAIVDGIGHFDLLSDAEVYERIRTWLADAPADRGAPEPA